VASMPNEFDEPTKAPIADEGIRKVMDEEDETSHSTLASILSILQSCQWISFLFFILEESGKTED
jgi:hypothetical protein